VPMTAHAANRTIARGATEAFNLKVTAFAPAKVTAEPMTLRTTIEAHAAAKAWDWNYNASVVSAMDYPPLALYNPDRLPSIGVAHAPHCIAHRHTPPRRMRHAVRDHRRDSAAAGGADRESGGSRLSRSRSHGALRRRGNRSRGCAERRAVAAEAESAAAGASAGDAEVRCGVR